MPINISKIHICILCLLTASSAYNNYSICHHYARVCIRGVNLAAMCDQRPAAVYALFFSH